MKRSTNLGLSGCQTATHNDITGSTMADREALQKRYAYHEMSNKVEQVDRSRLPSRRSEPSGEVESLRGKSGVGRMGDRVERKTKPSELLEKAQKKQKREPKSKPQKSGTSTLMSGGQTILDMNVSGYQPTTPSAMAAYEKLLVSRTILCVNQICVCLTLRR